MTQDLKAIDFPETLDGLFFKKAISIFIDYKELIIKLVLLTALLSTLLFLFVTESMYPVNTEMQPESFQDLFDALIKAQVFTFTNSFILYIPQTFFMVFFISALPLMYGGYEINFNNLSKVNINLWFRLFIFEVAILLGQSIGLVFCIVPGIIIMITFAFTKFVVILEQSESVIKRSINIAAGNQSKIFSVFIVYFSLLVIPIFFVFIFSPSVPEVIEDISSTITLSKFLWTYIQNIYMSTIFYFLTTLFFQLYMMSRIDKGEIEVVKD